MPRFVTENAYQSNLAKQEDASSKTLAQLRQYKVTDSSSLKLEFFFYTNREDKAINLTNKLKEENYSVVYNSSAADPNLYVITGWTSPIKMDLDSVLAWTKQMCNIGYGHDCDFDGWGTNPSQ